MTTKSLSSLNSLSYIWQMEQLRGNILSRLDVCSLRALRLTSSEFLEGTTSLLFKRARIVFTTRCLTRSARQKALSRIGHLIKNFTFVILHSNKNFLPPLINPKTGKEVNYLYTPNTTMKSKSQRSKYASQELEDILIKQYPPIFHAATNIPAFINLISMMPNLQSFRILCQGTYLNHMYKKNAIDYALISLRIALERAPLYHLKKLSLCHIHPAGIRSLRHTIGYGCTPSASRRWKQIEELEVTMDSWDFHGDKSSHDHLRILSDFIRGFSPNLKKMSFIWSGQNGPCPFFIYQGPQLAYFNTPSKLFCETTSSMSPLPALPSRPNINFPNLMYLQLNNTTMTKIEVADLILRHHKTVSEFQFHDVLINGSSWEEALIPLNLVDERSEWLLFQSRHKIHNNASFFNTSHPPPSETTSDEVVDTIHPIFDKIQTSKELKLPKSSLVVHGEPSHRKRRRKFDRKEKDKQIQSQKMKNSTSSQCHDSRIPLDPNIQGVQRNIGIENKLQELSFDSKKRISTLKKAKQAVLKQLGREFYKESKNEKFCQEILNDQCLNSGNGMMYMAQESLSALVPLVLCR
ncbi:hypothetical protein OnM2_047004 [Erysiphe neolycopersici]|uniref:Uncharacterized protein n=1 Tax=Erysiphe neolycopersici TaxID=212602 RepID=A0A420HTN7_9PEZI|nr:hypothetical protein OnM2_047004 [Erysiphe neolycopersici]